MEGWCVDEEELRVDAEFGSGVRIPHDFGRNDGLDPFSAISRFVWCCTPSVKAGSQQSITSSEFTQICSSCQKVLLVPTLHMARTGAGSDTIATAKLSEQLYKRFSEREWTAAGSIGWAAFRNALHRLSGIFNHHATAEQRASWLAQLPCVMQTVNRITSLSDPSDEVPVSVFESMRTRTGYCAESTDDFKFCDAHTRGKLFEFKDIRDVSPDPTFKEDASDGLFGAEKLIRGHVAGSSQDSLEQILVRAAQRSRASSTCPKHSSEGGWLPAVDRVQTAPSLALHVLDGGPGECMETLKEQDIAQPLSTDSMLSSKSTPRRNADASKEEQKDWIRCPSEMTRVLSRQMQKSTGDRRLHSSQSGFQRAHSAAGYTAPSGHLWSRERMSRMQHRRFVNVDAELDRAMLLGRKKVGGESEPADARWVCVFTGQVLTTPPTPDLMRDPVKPLSDPIARTRSAGGLGIRGHGNLAEGLVGVGRRKIRLDTSVSLDRMQARLVLRMTTAPHPAEPALSRAEMHPMSRCALQLCARALCCCEACPQ
eukprot:534882-Rhodomonas_salina.2